MPNKQETKEINRVAKTLLKQGLKNIIKETRLMWSIPLKDRLKPTKKTIKNLPKKIKNALEELGGLYTQLGLFLSTRPDLIPQQYCEEFSKIKNEEKPEQFETTKKTIKKETRKPLEKTFLHINKTPLESTSTTTTYKARLTNEKSATIKVQKAKQFQEQIQTIKFIARKIKNPKINAEQIAKEFEAHIKKELNFTKKAKNIEKIRKLSKEIEIPKVYKNLTTQKLLTTQYQEGIKLTKILKHLTTTQKNKIIQTITNTITQALEKEKLIMIRPENILLLKNKETKIGLTDLNIEETDAKTIKTGKELLKAITTQNTKKITNTLLHWRTTKTNKDNFSYEINKQITQPATPTQQLKKLIEITAKNKIKLSKNLINMFSALLATQRIIKTINPEYTQKTTNTLDNFLQGEKIIKTKTTKPERPLQITDKLKKQAKQDLTKHKTIYTILAASLIISGSILTTTPPYVKGYSILSLTSYGTAAIFTVLLITALLKS